jgi:hypothetical protein
MRSTDSELGVPFVERRRGRRYLTKRNFGWFALAILLVVAGFNIRSEMRARATEEYGRLYGRTMKGAPAPEAMAVTEAEIAPVDEAASADPFALDAARREQYLGRPQLEPVPLVEPEAIPPAPVEPVPMTSEVRVVGGPEGVALVQDQRPAPVLGGGFGRP